MFTFCDVLHETKQKNTNKLLRVCSMDWKSSLMEIKKAQVCKKAPFLIPSCFTAYCDHMTLMITHVWNPTCNPK